MSMNYAAHYNTKKTSQKDQIPGTEKNNAGGYSFTLDHWGRLERFLVLGSEGGTYYAGQHKLTRDNAVSAQKCIDEDGVRVVDIVVDISDKGRAISNDPALFILAMCAAATSPETRKHALDNLSKVARIGTHLFHFVEYVEGFRGWGRALRRAVGNWYLDKETDSLAYQAVKYKQRDGWSHRDVLRLAHPKTTDDEKKAVFDWICRGTQGEDLPGILRADVTTVEQAIEAIRKYNLPREVIPTELLNDVRVWEAMLPNMPLMAAMRNLGVMSSKGMFEGGKLNQNTQFIVEKFNAENIRKSRLHPLSILNSLNTYKNGQGFRGSLTWTVSSAIIDVLDKAFYMAFENVEPTGKNIMIALDVSGSMDAAITGTQLTARTASSALSLITASTEENYEIVGFTGGSMWSRDQNTSNLQILDITPNKRMDDVINYVDGLRFGGTDCALPMLYALDKNLKVDAFVVYTDSETWAGAIHPMEALRKYRRKTGIDAKLIVVGMTSTGFSIADASDPGCLDVVGFDTSTPQVISDFIRG